MTFYITDEQICEHAPDWTIIRRLLESLGAVFERQHDIFRFKVSIPENLHQALRTIHV